MAERQTKVLDGPCACGGSRLSGSTGAHPSESDMPASAKRRLILQVTLAIGALVLSLRTPGAVLADDADEKQKNARPKEGDLFVFVSGDKLGQVIIPADITADDRPVLAWPMDPASKTVRDGSRLNQVVLVHLDPASLDEVTRAHAADGIVAYSAVCTHQQCPVNGWNAEQQLLHCQCHQSDFDPKQSGKHVFGPAPRPLPALPVKIADGSLLAAGTFLSKVGVRSS